MNSSVLPNISDDFQEDRFVRQLEAEHIIAREPSTKKLFREALSAASSDANVLITGDSGTGKDCLANFIHRHSSRAAKPIVHVNCSAIPEELFESELFGYAPGTFTGSLSAGKKGLVHEAAGGTLFLDEIGELSLSLQAKLLPLVQDHVVRSIGSGQNIPVSLRLICATNRNLERMVEQKTFRLDLYYRLNIIPLRTLPLRDRPLDLQGLLQSLSDRYAEAFGRRLILTPDALRFLETRPWSGNVREAENFMEKLYVLEEEETVTREALETRYTFSDFSQFTPPRSSFSGSIPEGGASPV